MRPDDQVPTINTTGSQPSGTASMYCLRCQQDLVATEKSTCTRCGLQYDSTDPATYRDQPEFLWWRFWFPGFCLAVASGTLSYAWCLQIGNLGFALFVAVPVSIGAILGYATRARIWVIMALGIMAMLSVIVTLLFFDLSGLFCGVTLSIIFVLPVLGGVLLGWLLRITLHATRWDQRWFLPLVVLAVLPLFVQLLENRLPRPERIVTVRTRLHVKATQRQAWNAIMFYEEVQHDPPWLLRLCLPQPQGSAGDKQRVGQIVRCQYDRGYLVKRISRRKKERLLAFEVVDQRLHFERDVTLLDGSFEIRPATDHTAQISVTTRYQRHLYPRWLWEPVEREIIHTLHEHVLEGMRREAEEGRRYDHGTSAAFDQVALREPKMEVSNHRGGN